MHWTERQRAVACIGEELQRRGFTLYGYTQDKSDPMTDYYAPATWDGVATHPDHPDVVVCVDAARTSQSGRDGWPIFHATPKGKTWHVERDGQIVKTGAGLQRCARWGEEGQAATEALVDKIEAVVTGNTEYTTRNTVTAATGEGYTIEHDRDWTWLRFDDKPCEAVREALREQLGAHWGRRRRAWYIKEHVAAETIIAIITSVTE
jgi:hypothetical protein